MKMQYSSKIGHVPDMRFLTTSLVIQQSPKPISESEREIIKQEQSGKMRWGAPTWYLFHTLAEKVKDESFSIVRKELLNIIITICSNLPCPDCAGHATRYMNGVNLDSIQTKQNLKDLLFRFHNSVNSRKNFPLFSQSELDNKYVLANTVAIIQNFFQSYDRSSSSSKLSVNFLYRTTSIANIRSWLTLNISHFNM